MAAIELNNATQTNEMFSDTKSRTSADFMGACKVLNLILNIFN